MESVGDPVSAVFHSDVVVSLAELASSLFRDRVWMHPSTEWESGYIECVNRLFGDSGLQDALTRGAVYGEDVDAPLRVLDELTDRLDHRRSDEKIVADPLFQQVAEIAAGVLPFVILRSSFDVMSGGGVPLKAPESAPASETRRMSLEEGEGVSDESVDMRLTRAEVLVFFEWLASANETDVLPADEAEHRALRDLESQLEAKLVEPFLPNYSALVSEAKRAVLGA